MSIQQETSPQHIHWVGIDVAKKTFDAALVRHGQKFPTTPLAALPVHSFQRTVEGIGEFLQWLAKLMREDDVTATARVVMEATGCYSTELAVWLTEQNPSLAPAIAPPRQTSAFIKSLGLRNKTDKLEARALGFYGMERQPKAYLPMTAKEASLRELVRYRNSLVQQRVAEGNRVEEMRLCPFAGKMARRRLVRLDQDIKKVEQEMRKLVDTAAEIKRDIDQLCTIYGVAFITAVIVRAELGDLRRFARSRQMVAFAGLNPSLWQSGSSVNGKPQMSKTGNPRVRQALYLSAMVAIRGDNDLQRDYLRLQQQGKSAMAALGAIMRKLLVLMRAILISGKPFDPMWKTRQECA